MTIGNHTKQGSWLGHSMGHGDNAVQRKAWG